MHTKYILKHILITYTFRPKHFWPYPRTLFNIVPCLLSVSFKSLLLLDIYTYWDSHCTLPYNRRFVAYNPPIKAILEAALRRVISPRVTKSALWWQVQVPYPCLCAGRFSSVWYGVRIARYMSGLHSKYSLGRKLTNAQTKCRTKHFVESNIRLKPYVPVAMFWIITASNLYHQDFTNRNTCMFGWFLEILQNDLQSCAWACTWKNYHQHKR